MAAVNLLPDLNASVHQTLTEVARRHILSTCWKKTLNAPEFQSHRDRYMTYFHHYESACQNRSINDVGLLRHIDILDAFREITTHTYRDSVVQLTTLWSGFQDPSLHNIKDPQAFVQDWILLTAEALLLLDISGWTENTTLKTFLVQTHFPLSTQKDTFRIPRSFNSRNLSKIGGFSIRWTDILSEHLMLEKEDTQIAVFHQSQALEFLTSHDIYPQSLLSETRNTLDLLFPIFDQKSKLWFEKQVSKKSARTSGSSGIIDPKAVKSSNLNAAQRNISSFNYFRDRLISLKDEYDSHKPQSLRQRWYDRRNPTQWWAFYIATLVFVFGVAQVVEGAIQCYKAYYPS